MTHRPTSDFRAQDWIMIMEALIEWTWPPTEASEERIERAWDLIDAIADTQGMPPDELINQVDEEWQGPSG